MQADVSERTHRSFSWRIVFPLALAAASLLPLWSAAHKTYPVDDALITVTYARNLAEGNGFRYNGGAPTFGTTTPLTAITLAALNRTLPAVDLPRLAIYFSALCWIANAWLLWFFHRGLGLTAWQGAIIGLSLLTIYETYLGGEYALFALIQLTVVLLFVYQRTFLCGIAIGLLFMTRGEGGLMLPLAGIAEALRWHYLPERKVGLLAVTWTWLITGFCASGGVWLIYAWITFGWPLPHTLGMKMLQARNWADALGGLFQEELIRRMRGEWGVAAFSFFSPARAVLWLLAAGGIWFAKHHARPFLLLAAWTAVYVSVYVILQVPGYTYWYTLPPLWTWHYLIGLGLCAIGIWGAPNAEVRPGHAYSRLRPIAARGIVVLVLALLAAGRIRTTLSTPEDRRAPIYIAYSEWVREHSQPGDTLVSYDAGYLGYYSQLPIYDFAGLIRPELHDLVSADDREGIVARVQPRFVVKTFEHQPEGIGRTVTFGGISYIERFQRSCNSVSRYHHFISLFERQP